MDVGGNEAESNQNDRRRGCLYDEKLFHSEELLVNTLQVFKDTKRA